MCMYVVYYCILGFFCVGSIDFAVIFVVHTSASDFLGIVSEMTFNVLSGTLNLTHSLTHSAYFKLTVFHYALWLAYFKYRCSW